MSRLADLAQRHVERLCKVTPDRRPGSTGNREATAYVGTEFRNAGWVANTQEFPVLDWETSGGEVTVGNLRIDLSPSPYGLGVEATGPVRVLTTPADLGRSDLTDSVVVLTGDLAVEPLTPKAFPFYGSDEHAAIVAALEEVRPAAVLAVTGLSPALCGALDPFPLIEDGDFEIPTANLRPEDTGRLLAADGASATVVIESRRWPAVARNVIATRGPSDQRITVIAHVDSKPGTPGAVDNAAGVAVLLLLAELLGPDEVLPVGVELFAVNGEDHYSAAGELAWLAENDLTDVALAINIDGAGYRVGASHYSTYNVEGPVADHVDTVLGSSPGLEPGPPWFQSDHAIFAMQGRPALAFTTAELDEMLEVLFHAETDTPDQVDPDRLVEIADGIARVIRTWPA